MNVKPVALIAISLLSITLALIYFWPRHKLAWHEQENHKWAALPIPKHHKPGFTLLPSSETGITSLNRVSTEHIAKNRFLLNGSGVAAGDVDGDGLVDLYFARLESGNILYKNLGNWKFKDITQQAGVACANQFSTGATFADIDADGDLDLLVTALGGPNACFLNDGTGKFADSSQESGIVSNLGATTMALADIEGDGDLDLYLANYKTQTVQDLYPNAALVIDSTIKKSGNTYAVRPEFQKHYTIQIKGDRLERFEYAEPDVLLLNDGNGRFTKAENVFFNEDGKPAPAETDWGLTARFQDIDNDGDPDLYVCNDYESPDRLWLNDGTGHFRAIPKLAIRHFSASSMGVDFSDIDRDGDLDFFLAEMYSREPQRRKTQMGPVPPTPAAIGEIDNRPQYMRNTLFLNRGDMTYAEIAAYAGIDASEWSWSPLFLDVDLDGFEDLLVVTGHYYDAMDRDTQLQLKTMSTSAYRQLQSEVFAYPRLETPNFIFRNQGDLTFKDVSKAWGFETTDVSHGMATGDFDNDGDLDVVINRLEAPAAIYRNEASSPRLAVRLRGLAPNTQGIGAKIKVLGGPAPQSKEVICGGSYVSGSDPMCVFAANQDEMTIEVIWRNGKRSIIREAKPNRIYEIAEASAQDLAPANHVSPAASKPYFEDVSALIDHVHHEDSYDDFARQPLLPNRLSQSGPGISWYDLDGDGNDDLIIGSGKGGELAYFQNDGKSDFNRSARFILRPPQDQTTILGWTQATGAPSLLIGSSNFEDQKISPAAIRSYDAQNQTGNVVATFDDDLSSIGPLAMADYDNDGDLDLFAGGRSIPGRYPEPASSQLYRNDNGAFKIDQQNSAALKNLGLVSGAVFSDIDSDGDADLILALEWGPIKILRNIKGSFSDATAELGLANYLGRWNGVTTGDLNEDGRLDIIATNWGLNNKHRNIYVANPSKILYTDFDNNGTLDVVEARFDSALSALIPERGFASLANAIPYIRSRTPTYREFGSASLEKILGHRLTQAYELQANTLSHTLFLNSGDGFKAMPLPAEAQLAPAFYAGVADFDGDGHDDVFLSQNFFAVAAETPRDDAGRGLWLKGDGTGKLEPIPGQISGVQIYGEQRGAALGDYDNDGRVDLAVSQNGAATKLYHNAGAKAGLRVRLSGPKENPFGVGATMRLVYANGYGPAREVHSGSGYWSQDAMTQIMGTREQPRSIEVRWPGGRLTNVAIHERAKGVTISFEGKFKVNIAE